MEPENQNNPGTQEAEVVTDEIKDNKTFAVLGYVLPFLFFLPLLDEKSKNVPFARFHANQQLILLIIVLGVQFVHSVMFMALGGLGYFIMNILSVVLLAMIIFGAFHAHKGHMREFPIVGHFRILK